MVAARDRPPEKGARIVDLVQLLPLAFVMIASGLSGEPLGEDTRGGLCSDRHD
jgi:hypothetical protein